MEENTKLFKVATNSRDDVIAWNVTRMGHKTKGNYLMAEFYDRGAIKLFIEALESKGFVQVVDDQ
ncbi:hypothetical protein [Brevibacillus sp. HB2.2]|uniref:hypothetical protein n=1 Tax=Brevibacillus sp. HB2.2 TaxID=2738846 RepID=UPI00156B08A2|nr:hypothetical protein [Brevibacillus sp. HB2.2]NRS52073.1 hypothetical protein [Brevibacillus sp. HB2.2]